MCKQGNGIIECYIYSLQAFTREKSCIKLYRTNDFSIDSKNNRNLFLEEAEKKFLNFMLENLNLAIGLVSK
jgi:hypothetical protein